MLPRLTCCGISPKMNFILSASVIGLGLDELGLGAKGVGPRLMRRLEEEVEPLKLSMIAPMSVAVKIVVR